MIVHVQRTSGAVCQCPQHGMLVVRRQPKCLAELYVGAATPATHPHTNQSHYWRMIIHVLQPLCQCVSVRSMVCWWYKGSRNVRGGRRPAGGLPRCDRSQPTCDAQHNFDQYQLRIPSLTCDDIPEKNFSE